MNLTYSTQSPHASQQKVALSVVIPCYNEIECIDECYARVSAAARKVTGTDYEIIFVNGGSKDAHR